MIGKVVLKSKINENEFNLINDYAHNKMKEQITFLEDLNRLLGTFKILNTDNDITAGGWNVTCSNLDNSVRVAHNKSRLIFTLEEIRCTIFDLVDVWHHQHKAKKTIHMAPKKFIVG